ncbi:probable WRKY transcription factor protein 1 [Eurytemora carolleeae]|uniref:probable WRKY transcription factor protein 1 n=1 Tax=Eurytemora carolleeae TaxID=1294199 RepID=UPI000C77AC29|nr:probable WRKY transcription factor protein 1 [Eurytemora carolleeae]|eukprot:XP_023347430.1 probable WRKY transcription factor protein 1 [Eurytemora affinis]
MMKFRRTVRSGSYSVNPPSLEDTGEVAAPFQDQKGRYTLTNKENINYSPINTFRASIRRSLRKLRNKQDKSKERKDEKDEKDGKERKWGRKGKEGKEENKYELTISYSKEDLTSEVEIIHEPNCPYKRPASAMERSKGGFTKPKPRPYHSQLGLNQVVDSTKEDDVDDDAKVDDLEDPEILNEEIEQLDEENKEIKEEEDEKENEDDKNEKNETELCHEEYEEDEEDEEDEDNHDEYIEPVIKMKKKEEDEESLENSEKEFSLRSTKTSILDRNSSSRRSILSADVGELRVKKEPRGPLAELYREHLNLNQEQRSNRTSINSNNNNNNSENINNINNNNNFDSINNINSICSSRMIIHSEIEYDNQVEISDVLCTTKTTTSEEPISQTMDTEEPKMKKDEENENKVENKRKKSNYVSDVDKAKSPAIVTHVRKSEKESELNLNIGDIVFLHRRLSPEWYYGERHGVMGLIPANFIKILAYGDDGEEKVRAVAKMKYSARTDRELSLEVGQLVYIIHRLDYYWFTGHSLGQVGLVPASYLDILSATKDGGLPPVPVGWEKYGLQDPDSIEVFEDSWEEENMIMKQEQERRKTREKEKERQRELERIREKEKERDRIREIERLREREKDRLRERSRERVKDRERHREKSRDRQRHRDKSRDRQRYKRESLMEETNVRREAPIFI